MTVFKLDRINIRHVKRATILRKLRDKDIDWSSSRINSDIQGSINNHNLWTIAIYARLVGWTDMKELGTRPDYNATTVDPRSKGSVVARVRAAHTHLLFGQESVADRPGTWCALEAHRDLYLAPDQYSADEHEELTSAIHITTDPNNIDILRAADALPPWHMYGGLAGVYAILSGVGEFMREPCDAPERVRRDMCYQWVKYQQEYMDT